MKEEQIEKRNYNSIGELIRDIKINTAKQSSFFCNTENYMQ